MWLEWCNFFSLYDSLFVEFLGQSHCQPGDPMKPTPLTCCLSSDEAQRTAYSLRETQHPNISTHVWITHNGSSWSQRSTWCFACIYKAVAAALTGLWNLRNMLNKWSKLRSHFARFPCSCKHLIERGCCSTNAQASESKARYAASRNARKKAAGVTFRVQTTAHA
jgi:hypothetical protein